MSSSTNHGSARAWVAGARPRTLPAAIAPVLAGSGAAAYVDSFVWWKALLCLGLSVSLQIGVNYANDYSDGIKGTDSGRVGPMRLVGSGTASAEAVKRAAFAWFGLGALFGFVLAATSSWWLLLVGAVSIAAAWTYTGGAKPYGYRALGEVSVFVFFGLVAVLGTAFVQVGGFPAVALPAAIGVGALACAILVANNLRDIDTDMAAGKRTLEVVLGRGRSRLFYVGLMVLPAGCLVWAAVIATPYALLGLLYLLWAGRAVTVVLRGATGTALIGVLGATGIAGLVYALGLAAGLCLP